MNPIIKTAIIIPVAFCFMAGCQRDTMPITTSSPQALQYFMQARDLTEKWRRHEAVDYFQKAIALDSNFVLAYYYMVDSYLPTKQRLEYFDRAYKNLDKVSKGERLLVESVHEAIQGNTRRQQDLLEKLVQMYPKDEQLYLTLGNFYFSQRQWEQAIVTYKQALQINPEFSIPYNQIGYCYRYLGDYAEAEKALKKYIKLIPDNPNPYDSYAELLLRMGEYEVSIENYEKALQLDPNFVYSYIGIATNLNFKKEYEEARRQLMAMYRIVRGDAEISMYYYAVAVSYAEEGNLDLARAELEKRYDLAAASYDTLAMNSAIHTIVQVLLDQGKMAEARAKTEAAYKLYQEANLPLEVKQWSAERIFLDRAIIAVTENNCTEARNDANLYEQGVAKHENPLMMLTVTEVKAMIDLAEKKYDQVIAELEQAPRDDSSILYLQAKAHRGKGDLAAAQKYYKQILTLNELNSLEYAMTRHRAEKELLQIATPLNR
jgi:tetratricopeptide (TPR) repeat protein